MTGRHARAGPSLLTAISGVRSILVLAEQPVSDQNGCGQRSDHDNNSGDRANKEERGDNRDDRHEEGEDYRDEFDVGITVHSTMVAVNPSAAFIPCG